MNKSLEKALSITVNEFGGDRVVIDGTIGVHRLSLLMGRVPRAKINWTKDRIRELRQARKWGTSRTARWN